MDNKNPVVVPKFVKDRLIRIETRMFDFHQAQMDRLDEIYAQLSANQDVEEVKHASDCIDE